MGCRRLPNSVTFQILDLKDASELLVETIDPARACFNGDLTNFAVVFTAAVVVDSGIPRVPIPPPFTRNNKQPAPLWFCAAARAPRTPAARGRHTCAHVKE